MKITDLTPLKGIGRSDVQMGEQLKLEKLKEQLAEAEANVEHNCVIGTRWRKKYQKANEREAVLREAFTNYRNHVGTCAPLTWASVNSLEYIELAHKWEVEWKVLDDEAKAALEVK